MLRLNNLPEYLSSPEVAELLRIHRRTFSKWNKKDLFPVPFTRVGKRGDRRYKREDILAFLNQNDNKREITQEEFNKRLKEGQV